MSVHVFRIKDDSQEIHLAAGEGFCLVFEENPTTGFIWHLPESVPGFLTLERDESESHGTAPGAGGERRFHFSSQSPGKGSILFTLRRPWEAKKPLKEIEVKLVVQ